jgi:hypothetical protein
MAVFDDGKKPTVHDLKFIYTRIGYEAGYNRGAADVLNDDLITDDDVFCDLAADTVEYLVQREEIEEAKRRLKYLKERAK